MRALQKAMTKQSVASRTEPSTQGPASGGILLAPPEFWRSQFGLVSQAHWAGTAFDQVVAAARSSPHFNLEGGLPEHRLCSIYLVTFKKLFEATIKIKPQACISRIGHMFQERGEAFTQRLPIIFLTSSIASGQAADRLQQIQGQRGVVVEGKEPFAAFLVPLQPAGTQMFLQLYSKWPPSGFDTAKAGSGNTAEGPEPVCRKKLGLGA